MVSGVRLYEKSTDYHSISVDKEVVKNSGEDSTSQYRNGNVYSKVSDLTTDYDTGKTGDGDGQGYIWRYPLHDGIHRTVDGTVTWKTTVSNNASEGSDYEPFSYGLLSDTIDSPYELAELNVPDLLFSDEE